MQTGGNIKALERFFFQEVHREVGGNQAGRLETVALLYVIDNRAELDWVFSLNDPALLVIELHPQVRTEEIISLIHTAGKLSSENSWHFSKSNELFGATCTELFKLKIDIAISNRPKSCLQQKKNF